MVIEFYESRALEKAAETPPHVLRFGTLYEYLACLPILVGKRASPTYAVLWWLVQNHHCSKGLRKEVRYWKKELARPSNTRLRAAADAVAQLLTPKHLVYETCEPLVAFLRSALPLYTVYTGAPGARMTGLLSPKKSTLRKMRAEARAHGEGAAWSNPLSDGGSDESALVDEALPNRKSP